MILSVSNLSFSYNGKAVLDDIAFELPRGKILALLGINGVGKSTLLRCLAAILKHDGSVVVDGRQTGSMSRAQVAKYFAYVPQNQTHSRLSVFDMVLLGRKPHMQWGPVEQDFRLVEQTLCRMGLDKLSMRQVDRLSGGELQKVVMARALVQNPQVLLLDEPTSNLDLANQLQVMDLMKQAVVEQNLSAVVSVHDINLAFRYADIFLMLKGGAVHSLASTDEVTCKMIEDVYGVEVIMEKVHDYKVVIPVGTSQ